MSEEKAKEYRIADNKTAELTEWDNWQLEGELKSISDKDFLTDFFDIDFAAKMMEIKLDNPYKQQPPAQIQPTNHEQSVQPPIPVIHKLDESSYEIPKNTPQYVAPIVTQQPQPNVQSNTPVQDEEDKSHLEYVSKAHPEYVMVELLMKVEDKKLLYEIINRVKAEQNIQKQADALMFFIKQHI